MGPLGPPWAHLGPLSLPSCHPTSLWGTYIAEIRLPKPHLASFAKPSTFPKHNYVLGFSEVCYLPSSQHVIFDLALQSPSIQPGSPPRHPKLGTRSSKIIQYGPKIAPQNVRQSSNKSKGHILGTPSLATLAFLVFLRPILGHFRSQVTIQLRCWARPWPKYDLQRPILQALLHSRPAQNIAMC